MSTFIRVRVALVAVEYARHLGAAWGSQRQRRLSVTPASARENEVMGQSVQLAHGRQWWLANDAANTLQTLARSHLDRQAFEGSRVAATRVQATRRGQMGRRVAQERREEANRAAYMARRRRLVDASTALQTVSYESYEIVYACSEF